MPFILPAIEAIGSILGTVGTAAATGLEAVGLPAAFAAPIGAGVTTGLEGAGIGGLTAAATGGNILKGIESGGLSGFGAGALGPVLGGITGSPLIGDALGGALGGAAGAAATGGNIATGALEGGIGGGLKGAFSTSPSAAAVGGGTTSAAASAAPSSVPLSSPDVSSAIGDVTTQSGIAPPSSAGTSALSSPLPGSVGAGAAAGGASSGLTQTPALDQLSVSPNTSVLSGPLNTTAPTPGAITAGGGATTAGGFNLGKALSNPTTDMALLMGANALKGNQQTAQEKQLSAIAAQDQQQGQQLESYLTSGTLPPGMQHALDATKTQQSAALKSQYAAHGMSGSSAEVQDLAGVQDRIQQQGIQVAENLYSQGVTEMGQASTIYGELMQQQIAQDNAFSSSLGNLVSALALSSRPITYAGG